MEGLKEPVFLVLLFYLDCSCFHDGGVFHIFGPAFFLLSFRARFAIIGNFYSSSEARETVLGTFYFLH